MFSSKETFEVAKGKEKEKNDEREKDREKEKEPDEDPRLSPRARAATSPVVGFDSPDPRRRGITLAGDKPVRTLIQALTESTPNLHVDMGEEGQDGKTTTQKLANLGVQFRNLKDINKDVRGSRVDELRLSKLGIKTRKGEPAPRSVHPVLDENARRRSLRQIIRDQMEPGLKEKKCDNPSALLKQSFSSTRPLSKDYSSIIRNNKKTAIQNKDEHSDIKKDRRVGNQLDQLKSSGNRLSLVKYKAESTNSSGIGGSLESDIRVDHLNYMWEKKLAKMLIKTRQKDVDMRKLELRRFPFHLCYSAHKFLVKLDLSKNRITSLKDLEDSGRGVFEGMKVLQELNLSSNMLTEIPEDIARLSKLRILDLSKNQIARIDPKGLPQLTLLEDLILSKNKLTELPEEMCQLTGLLGLSLQGNKLTSLPKNMGNLSNLLALNLSSNEFRDLPNQVCEIKQLQELFLAKNKIAYLREGLEIHKLDNLMLLDLSDNVIQDLLGSSLSTSVAKKVIGDQLCSLRELVVFSLQGNQLTSLPNQLWQLKRLRVLTLTPGNEELFRSNYLPLDVVDRGTKAILSHLKKKGKEPKGPKLDLPASKKLSDSQDIAQFLRAIIEPEQKANRPPRPARPNFRASLAYFNPNAPKTRGTYNANIPGISITSETDNENAATTTDAVSDSEPSLAAIDPRDRKHGVNFAESAKPIDGSGDSIIHFLLETDMKERIGDKGVPPPLPSTEEQSRQLTKPHLDEIPKSHQSLRELKRALPFSAPSFPTTKARAHTVAGRVEQLPLIAYTYNWRTEDGTDDGVLSYYLLDSKSELHVVEGSESPKPSPKQGSDIFANDIQDELFPLENPANYLPHYRDYFYDQAHTNLLGWDKKLGPLAISVMKEKDHSFNSSYWFLLRSQHGTEVGWIPEAKTSTSRIARFPTPNQLELALKKTLKPHLKKAELHPVKGAEVRDALLELEKLFLVRAHKFGVVYCKEDQQGPEMFDNAEGDQDFEEFLNLLGDKINLQDWKGYCGGLDIKKNQVLYDYTGRQSVFTKFKDLDIMFHVSTLLPYSVADDQKVRKEHIGGDVAVIVFLQGRNQFYPDAIATPVNNVFAVVSVDKIGGKKRYRIAFTCRDEVNRHGPPVPEKPSFEHNAEFKEFLLTKLVNAERAAYDSSPLADGIIQTRLILVSELVQRFLHPLKPTFEMKTYATDTLPRKKKLLKLDSSVDLRKDRIEKGKKAKPLTSKSEPARPTATSNQGFDLYSSVELEDEMLRYDDRHYREEDEEEDVYVVHRATVYNDRTRTESEQRVLGEDDEDDFHEKRFIKKNQNRPLGSRDELYGEPKSPDLDSGTPSPDSLDEECDFLDTAGYSKEMRKLKSPRQRMMQRVAEVGRFSKRAMSLPKIEIKNN